MHGLNSNAAVWSPSGSDLPLVLLLHGFGSNERDLAGLFEALPAEFQYVSLRAPLPMQGGFAWFPLTMHGATLAATGGRVAARAVADWVSEAGVAPVGAIGFSQGGALALELLRETGIPSLDWVAVLSGFVLEAEAPGEDDRDAALAARRPNVFWGRGSADMVITPDLVSRTLGWLPQHTDAQIEIYPGLPHSISLDEVTDLSTWMRERLS